MAVSATGPNPLLPQLQLQQAERAAERAEQNARNLRSQARQAQTNADRAQERAREMQVQSGQADREAGAARQGLSSVRSLQQFNQGVTNIRQEITELNAKPILPVKPVAPSDTAAPAPVVNSQGQTTGTLVNLTA